MREARGRRASRLLAGLLMLAYFPTSAQDIFFCTTLWPADDLLDALGDMPCQQYVVHNEQYLELAGQHRVFVPPNWLDSEAKQTVMDRSIKATTWSLSYYNDLARSSGFEPVTETNLILGAEDYVEGWEPGATVYEISDINFTGACPILVDSRSAMEMTSAEFQQLLAHEIFHCLQDKNGFQMYAGTEWWIEGAAEFFSNVLYCKANLEYEYSELYDNLLPPFRHLSPDLRYATVMFFQHLANATEPLWVFRRLFRLPPKPGPGVLAEETASWFEIAELFHGFAQSFTDDRVFDSEDCFAASDYLDAPARTRAVLPRSLDFDASLGQYDDIIEVSGKRSETISFVVEPFTFKPQKIQFGAGKEFDLELETEDASGRISLEPLGAVSAWSELPAQLLTDCTGVQRPHLLLATSTRPTAAGSGRTTSQLRMRVTARDRTDCAMALLDSVPGDCAAETGGRALDACLVGSWRMTEESLLASLWGSPRPPEITEGHIKERHLEHQGSIMLAFDGSGTFVKQFNATFSHTKYDGTIAQKVVGHTITEYRGHVGGCVTSRRMPIGPNYLNLMSDLVDTVTKHTHGHRDQFAHGVNRLDKGTPWNHWPRLQGAGKTRFTCDGDTLTIGKREYRRIR